MFVTGFIFTIVSRKFTWLLLASLVNLMDTIWEFIWLTNVSSSLGHVAILGKCHPGTLGISMVAIGMGGHIGLRSLP